MEFPASSIFDFNRTAASSAILSGASSKISSCTTATILISVPLTRSASIPSAFLTISAAVPCTGVLHSPDNPEFGGNANLEFNNVNEHLMEKSKKSAVRSKLMGVQR